MAAIQVNIRFPEILLSRIDHSAGEGERSKWILEACRTRLDGIMAGDNSSRVGLGSQPEPAPISNVDASGQYAHYDHPGMSSLEDRKEIAMQAMSDALMKEPTHSLGLATLVGDGIQFESPREIIPPNRCANRDQNMAGDWFRCIKEKGHKGNHLPSAFAEEY